MFDGFGDGAGEKAGFVFFLAEAQSFAEGAESFGWFESLRPAYCFCCFDFFLEEGELVSFRWLLASFAFLCELCERKRELSPCLRARRLFLSSLPLFGGWRGAEAFVC